MNKRSFSCGIGIVCLSVFLLISATCPPALNGAEPVRVLVLPFKINAPGEMSDLSRQVADLLGQQLKAGGAEIISPPPQAADEALRAVPDPAVMARLAESSDAGHVVWGSMTQIGDSFSLDAHLLTPQASLSPENYHVEGRGLENLVNAVKDLSDQIGFRLFGRERVAQVRIEGNQRIESDAILRVVKSQAGTVYQPGTVSEDIRAIFAMGYFDDVRASAETGPAGKIVTFHIKEKPTVRRIKLQGNSRIDEKTIKENMTLSTGAVLNIFKIRNNVDQIEKLYKEKNYHKVKVDYKIEPLENNQADLTFVIDEGPKLYVTDISFEGNKAFSAKQLKKEMKTSEKGFFYWLTSSGDLDRTTLDQDIERLGAFYHNSGYIEARVGEPRVTLGEKNIAITIKIEEGPRFKVGKVDVSGDLIQPRPELLAQMATGKETWYNRETVRKDVISLSDIYGNRGYADVDIAPQIKEDPATKVVDIDFVINKGPLVYFDRIIISGNTRTRDKVIRRELEVREQERFDQAALKKSIRNLYRLDYFEDIKVETIKSPDKSKMTLKIDVTEKPTGNFSFGAGYSGEEDVFLTGAITERNFLGRGQTLNFNGQLGSRTTRFSASFTEPYLFDSRWSGSVELYNQLRDLDTYERSSLGGGLRVGYLLFEYTRLYLGYRYDLSEVKDVTADAPNTILELNANNSGLNATSSADFSLVYDSRDVYFNTTEGSRNSIYFEHAGIGGDIGFDKVILDSGWYFPFPKGFVGFLHAKLGYVTTNSDKLLPDYEKFYLGGINSLRGFGFQGVHLTETNDLGKEVEVGGNYMAQFNVEMSIPLLPKMNVSGVVFYDTGNVYRDGYNLGDLRQSAGAGFRWYSPIAPIRLEYGHILDRREGDPSGRWEFTMGGTF